MLNFKNVLPYRPPRERDLILSVDQSYSSLALTELINKNKTTKQPPH